MKQIEVRVDKRTELMEVLLYVSDYRKEYPNLVLYNKDIPYVKDVYNTFNKFSNHKAVKFLNEIVENLNFSYDAPFQLAWELKDDYTVGTLKANPFKYRLKSAEVVKNFMNEIADFAKQSGFDEFYEAHKPYYNACIERVKQKTDFEELSHFEEFFKEKTNRQYILNLLPLSSRNGCYYDLRFNDKFVMNITNDTSEEFKNLADNLEGWVFRVFTLCEIRKVVETKNMKIPQSKQFEDIQKSQFTSSNNVQFVCECVASVVRTVFKEKFCKQYLEKEPDLVKNELQLYKSKNNLHAFEIYDILVQWRKSNEPIEKYLQQIFDLF